MLDYINTLYKNVPTFVFEALLSVLCIGIVITLALKGFKKGWRVSSFLLLAAYLIFLYASTVVFRASEINQEYNLEPFWSYQTIDEEDDFLFKENISNILAFIPLGLFIGMSFKQIKWWKVCIFALFVSISIEVLQFFLKRGFSEFDDVMHNTLGCMMGYGIYVVARYGYGRIYKRSVGVL